MRGRGQLLMLILTSSQPSPGPVVLLVLPVGKQTRAGGLSGAELPREGQGQILGVLCWLAALVQQGTRPPGNTSFRGPLGLSVQMSQSLGPAPGNFPPVRPGLGRCQQPVPRGWERAGTSCCLSLFFP